VETFFKRCSRVYNEYREYFKHIDLDTLGQPLEVVELYLGVLILGEDSFFEIFGNHEERLPEQLPSADEQGHDLSRYISALKTLNKQRVGSFKKVRVTILSVTH
jgi:hypothetical protein